MSWRSDKVTDIMRWLDGYITRRYYGWTQESHDAWQMLLDAAYRFHWSWSIRSIATRAPNFGLSSDTSFNPGKIADAWRIIVSATVERKLNLFVRPLRYDIVDIGRQVLMNLFADVYKMYTSTYLLYNKTNNAELVKGIDLLGSTLIDILNDLDSLLVTDPNFLLGNWLSDATKSAGINIPIELRKLINFNARNQITMWGPHENIQDYAGKEWSGLVGTYYIQRWKLFINAISYSIRKPIPLNMTDYNERRFEFEQSWGNQLTAFPTTPSGDTLLVARSLLTKYFRDEDDFKKSYSVVVDQAVKGNELYGQDIALWTNSTEQLMWFCDINSDCAGFSLPNLSFKSSVEDAMYSPGSMLFIKNKEQ